MIEELKRRGAEIKHLDTLHSKLYLFDRCAVVDSSNVSANGLSLQGPELKGWVESNIIFDKVSGPFSDVESTFDKLWRSAKILKQADLRAAHDIWSRRRRTGLAQVEINHSDILTSLHISPKLLAGQRIYIVIDSASMSQSSLDAISEERDRLQVGKELDCWEGWGDMPEAATFINFLRGPRGGLRFTGLWYSPEKRREIENSDGVLLQLVDKVDNIKGMRKYGDIALWKELIDIAFSPMEDYGYLEIGEFSRVVGL